MICRMLSAMQIAKTKLDAKVPYLVIRPRRLNWTMIPLHIVIAQFSDGTMSNKLEFDYEWHKMCPVIATYVAIAG